MSQYENIVERVKNLPQWVYWLIAILGLVGIIVSVVVWLRLRAKGKQEE